MRLIYSPCFLLFCFDLLGFVNSDNLDEAIVVKSYRGQPGAKVLPKGPPTTTTTTTTTTTPQTTKNVLLRPKDGRRESFEDWKQHHHHESTTPEVEVEQFLPGDDPEVETSVSIHLFFVLTVLTFCILIVYALEHYKIYFLPESIAIIMFGGLVGVVGQAFNLGWEKAETFDPTSFFLFLLPPIIFESGYSLRRGDFFRNFYSIVLFAVVGTVLSALVIGTGLFMMGERDMVYKLSAMESFAFGSLISAVDPVATLAIFQALDADRTLYMLVFGESVLNDAVSIVLTRTILQLGHHDAITLHMTISILKEFLLASLGSATIGVVMGLLGAVILKHLDFHSMPACELGILCVFAYLPYLLAEGLDLSGIMAILFGGMTHAHYTSFNLTPATQVTARQIFRTIAFVSEVSVFLYLGMAMSSFEHNIQWNLVFASLFLCMIGRAVNIFPLAAWINSGNHSTIITHGMQVVMWFSGLRGAIAFALALHLPPDQFSPETKGVLLTTTLIIVIFTIVVFGGSTLPILKCLRPGVRAASFGRPNDHDHPDSDEEEDPIVSSRPRKTSYRDNFLLRLDKSFFIPTFRRRVTRQEIKEAQHELEKITHQWFERYEDGLSSRSMTASPSPLPHHEE